jgi:ribonuclease III
MTGSYQKLLEQIPLIEERIGYVFKDKEALALAFIHRSFFNENRTDTSQHNERLEFFGDSILGLLVSEYLYAEFPEEPEGRLSHLRAMLVEATMCALFIKKIDLAQFILLGKGEEMNLGKNKESIQADLFEALLAAIYLDGGMEAAKEFFWRKCKQEIEVSLKTPLRNWKAELQDLFQKEHQTLPSYKVLAETGPDHSKQFDVGVFLEEDLLGKGIGSSKKEGEQAAAKEALLKLEEKDGEDKDPLGV